MDRIRFLLGEHIPHAVAEALQRRGIDVVTANDANLRGAADEEYVACSRREGRVLVTQDRDFLRLHQEQDHAGIAYCEQRARTIGQVVMTLALMYEALEPGEMVGQVEFL